MGAAQARFDYYERWWQIGWSHFWRGDFNPPYDLMRNVLAYAPEVAVRGYLRGYFDGVEAWTMRECRAEKIIVK